MFYSEAELLKTAQNTLVHPFVGLFNAFQDNYDQITASELVKLFYYFTKILH